MTEVDEFLAHHGVKGMRWGKRKSGGSTSGHDSSSSGGSSKSGDSKKVSNGKSAAKNILAAVGTAAVASVVIKGATNLALNRMFNETYSIKNFN